MKNRGRERQEYGRVDQCTFCEGTKFHWGKECGACDGTGCVKVQKALISVQRAKDGEPLRIHNKQKHGQKCNQ